jgi:hypothetical protein
MVQVVTGFWYRLLVQVDSDRVIVTVIGSLHLALIFQSSRMGKGKGVVAFFQLEPENQGFAASFKLEHQN